MKIGILTFQFAHNYGALLQAYALREYLRENNDIEADIINYTPKNVADTYSLIPKYRDSFISYIRQMKYTILRLKQAKLFNNFMKDDLKLGRVIDDDTIEELNLIYDAVIVGSDQVWNTEITGKIKTYFLDFLNSNKIIASYAASFGHTIQDEFTIDCINNDLHRFNYISVRESDAKGYLERALQRNIEFVVDPVFLLNADVWSSLSNKSGVKIEKPFILYYSLKSDDQLIKSCEELSEKTGVDIIITHPMGWKQKVKGKQLYNIGPFEFLYLIRKAEYICTNSFHATVYSIIFGKKAITNNIAENNTRIGSLLDIMKVDNESDEFKNSIIDFAEADYSELNNRINSSKKYLDEIISNGVQN